LFNISKNTCGFPQYGTTLKAGTNLAISCCQLWSVDDGDTIKNGPHTPIIPK